MKKNQITKAIIPAAGLGTRVLPATKATPKEMLPIVDKPAIQYIVEEAVASGITDILIIISRNKNNIENHFDRVPELEMKLMGSAAYDEVVKISDLANIFYVRQQEQKGLGHAVLLAEKFVGDEPFAVLYGDDVITGEVPCTRQLVDAYEEYGKCSLAIKEVSKQDIGKYSSLKVENIKNNLYSVSDMVEKPAEGMELSLFSILGRVVITPEIFGILKSIPYGKGGELQLTDAMKILAVRDTMLGVDFVGKRYDMGSKIGIMKAQVEIAMNHPEIGKEFIEYLKGLNI
ncbi:MAG: UTP--glucose-1-phosphate uridylyltransferase [Ruminococcus sp.]|jgi:UTP--glucose-1-phosphate uridylyltransferase|nr:UTP--glucose-1-phosphate uridylyltransferase [Ruminococcus sp.]